MIVLSIPTILVTLCAVALIGFVAGGYTAMSIFRK